ncbi:hypothetical protein ACFLU6_13935, partial [Acidobacteriota bacterium]
EELVSSGRVRLVADRISDLPDGAMVTENSGTALSFEGDVIPGDFIYSEDGAAVVLRDGSATGAVQPNGVLDVMDAVIAFKKLPFPLEMSLQDAVDGPFDLYRWDTD